MQISFNTASLDEVIATLPESVRPSEISPQKRVNWNRMNQDYQGQIAALWIKAGSEETSKDSIAELKKLRDQAISSAGRNVRETLNMVIATLEPSQSISKSPLRKKLTQAAQPKTTTASPLPAFEMTEQEKRELSPQDRVLINHMDQSLEGYAITFD